MDSQGSRTFRRSVHTHFADRIAFERMLLCANTLTSIFSITATVFFGQLAFATGNGMPIAPLSPISFIPGHAFDRFVIITLENSDYDSASRDSNLQELTKEGILLERYYALTHPSQPNYIASVGGDYFGLNVDTPVNIPANVCSVVDLLENKGVSWGAYLESMPYTGYTAETGDKLYYRKHNPLVSYQSVAGNETRLAHIKNLTMFYTDLESGSLPQWMYVSPNILDDGHNTGITFAANWTRTFLTNLLRNSKFNNNTCVLITFDENEIYSLENRVYSVLLGDAIPSDLRGTNDSTFYTHYSQLSTVEANWGLYNLGRQDTNKSVSNVFAFVAKTVNYSNLVVTEYPLNNVSERGAFNSHPSLWAPIPSPNLTAQGAGGPILPMLTTMVYPPTQASRAQGVVQGSVAVAIMFAIGSGWYFTR